MKPVAVASITMILLVFVMVRASADEIILRNGTRIGPVNIESATYEQVDYKLPNIQRGQSQKSDEVERLNFDREPGTLGRARGALEQGDYGKAVELSRSVVGHPNPRWQANAMVVNGLALNRWAQQDAQHYDAAIKVLKEYLQKFSPKKDFYVPHATLLLAQAYTRTGKHSQAEKALKPLERGTMGKKWVAGGKLGLAQVRLAKQDFTGARRLFGELRGNAEVRQNAEFHGAANLGYALCQLGQKQYEPAIESVKKELVSAEGREVRLGHYAAQGWIVWGRADEALADGKREQLQWAMTRFVRAMVIAGAENEDLAEALYRAKEVWRELGETDRAQELQQRLNKLHPNSPWTKK